MGDGFLEGFLRKKRVSMALPFVKGDFLDIGCGTDPLFVRLASKRARTCVGIDPKIIPWKAENMSFFRSGFFGRLKFEKESFDTVACLAVFEHIEKKRELFEESFRVLRPSGLLVVTTPSQRAERILLLLEKVGFVSSEQIEEHKELLSTLEILNIAYSAGFECEFFKKFEFGFNSFFVFKKS